MISLMNQMRADLISNPPLAGSFTPRVGLTCAAIFSEDNNWSVQVCKLGSLVCTSYFVLSNVHVVNLTL